MVDTWPTQDELLTKELPLAARHTLLTLDVCLLVCIPFGLRSIPSLHYRTHSGDQRHARLQVEATADKIYSLR